MGRGVLAVLHMAQHSRTYAFTLVAVHPCAELHFPNGIVSVPIPSATPTAAGAPGGASSDSTPAGSTQTGGPRAVPHANRPCGSVNTLSAFICTAGAGTANPFVPRNTCGIWIQQSPALFLKQMLLAGSFAYPIYEKRGELLLLLKRKRRSLNLSRFASLCSFLPCPALHRDLFSIVDEDAAGTE